MRLKVTYFLFIAFTIQTIQAQKKSELIADIQLLKTQKDSLINDLAIAQKHEKTSLVKAESYEKQVKDLQSANSTLLRSLNNFAKVSNTNSENLNKALASVEKKEHQLKFITEAITKNDSTAVVFITNVKKSLGETAQISVSQGNIVVSKSLSSLFGNDTDNNVKGEAILWLEKISQLFNVSTNVHLTIEGLSMTGDFNLPTLQATAIANILTKKYSVPVEKLTITAKDGNFKEGISFIFHPKYKAFYNATKKGIKEANRE